MTVAVLTYNGRELVATVLDSLALQTYGDLRTVVVDNGSTDGTAELIAERWPQTTVVMAPENVGVTAGLNRCLEAGAGSEFVLVLNDDVELDPRCIEELVADMRAHPTVAAVQAKLLDFTRRDLLDGTGDSYSWAGLAHRRGQGEQDRGQYDDRADVFGVCGAAAMYRGSAVAAVGEFDAQLQAYCEDTDWSFRARLVGYGCRFVPGARVYHIGSAALGPRVSDFSLYQNWRNQIWVVAKNYPRGALLRHGPDLLMGAAATLYVAVRHRRLGLWLRAWRDALAGMPEMLAKRSQVHRHGRSPQLDGVIESGLAKLRWWLLGAGRSTAPAAGSPLSRRAADRPGASAGSRPSPPNPG